MQVIITHSFREDFEKQFKRYPIDIISFVAMLQKTSFISLENPLQKVKFMLHWVALRWIVVKKGEKLIPIFVILKSNKLWGRNLVLDKKTRKKVHYLLLEIEKDFLDKKYTIYK